MEIHTHTCMDMCIYTYFCILTALKMYIGHRNSITVKVKELLAEFQSWLYPLTSSDFEVG